MTGLSSILTNLPTITDPSGDLSVIEAERHVPFAIRRVFYIYNIPSGAHRGGHALKTCHQFLLALAGRFDVTVDDGVERERIQLCQGQCGLYLPPMVWREMDNFSSGSVCLVLASEYYSESDYFRIYDAFSEALTLS